ncbi:MAG: hypothetical protein AAB595_00815 [Patescibacteria group bacterium]
MFWIVLAVVFVVALFLLKTTSVFKNKETYQSVNQENSLTYDNVTIKDLVNKDTDGDGIPDWEEGLYGLDPTKKETAPGTPDNVAIGKLKSKTEQNQQGLPLLENRDNQGKENLTQTDKFSRELFATVAAASQNGPMDQATIDALSASLADKIQNSPPRKVFLISEIKTTSDDSVKTFTNYINTFNSLQKKYPAMDYTVLDVLQKFMVDENTVDSSVLVKLDPIIEQTKKVVEGMVKMTVPQSVSTLHLNVVNSLERLVENISDIKLYDSDTIMALGGISKYEENMTKLDSEVDNLMSAINQKLLSQQ